MAKKRRRKSGLQRCSICGSYQLLPELENGICLACLGLVGVKRWRGKPGQGPVGLATEGKAAAGAKSS
jgi:hypothetical protein